MFTHRCFSIYRYLGSAFLLPYVPLLMLAAEAACDEHFIRPLRANTGGAGHVFLYTEY